MRGKVVLPVKEVVNLAYCRVCEEWDSVTSEEVVNLAYCGVCEGQGSVTSEGSG